MEQTEKQTTDKEQCPHIKKKIGRTTYNVAIHFSKTSKETMTDKINRCFATIQLQGNERDHYRNDGWGHCQG